MTLIRLVILQILIVSVQAFLLAFSHFYHTLFHPVIYFPVFFLNPPYLGCLVKLRFEKNITHPCPAYHPVCTHKPVAEHQYHPELGL